jgi:hypothetical protein
MTKKQQRVVAEAIALSSAWYANGRRHTKAITLGLDDLARACFSTPAAATPANTDEDAEDWDSTPKGMAGFGPDEIV